MFLLTLIDIDNMEEWQLQSVCEMLRAMQKSLEKMESGTMETLQLLSNQELAKKLIDVISQNPYQIPPEYEQLAGDLKGLYSRRINHQHRLVYEVYKKEKIIKIVSFWSHYER